MQVKFLIAVLYLFFWFSSWCNAYHRPLLVEGISLFDQPSTSELQETLELDSPSLLLQDSPSLLLELQRFRETNIEQVEESQAALETMLNAALTLNDRMLQFEIQREQARFLAVLGKFKPSLAIVEQLVATHSQELSECDRLSLEVQRINLTLELSQIEVSDRMLKDFVRSPCAGTYLGDVDWLNGFLELMRGNFSSAVQLQQRAYDTFAEQENRSGMRKTLFSLGVSQFRLRSFDLSQKSFRESRQHFSPPYALFNELGLLLNLAASYEGLEDFDQAREFYEETQHKANLLGDSKIELMVLLNLAVLESKRGNTAAALVKYQQALDATELMDEPYGSLVTKMNMGTLLLQMGSLQQAETLLLEALEYTVSNSLIHEYQYVIKTLTEVYEKKGDMQTLTMFLKQQIKSLQTILDELQKRQIDELRARYELEIKEQELINTTLEATQVRNRFVLAIILLVLLASGLVAYQYFRNKNLKKLYRLNVDLLDTALISEIEEEKEHSQPIDPFYKVFQRIHRAMEEEKLYRLPELSLPLLSSHVASNEKYTSSAISTYAKMNFNNYVNRYRINEAKRLLLQRRNDAIVSDIMIDCGFASRSTFYKAFNDTTGMSPKEFVRYSNRTNDQI
jgi:AraC-like DNA-binding protein/tetratricopeptide (TPR) repeat protein